MTPKIPRVLIVEDNSSDALLFEMTLQRRGHFETVLSEDVDEILKLAESGSIDLVVMDVSLERSTYNGKKVDGTDISRMLKSRASTRSIPIVLATAHAIIGDRERLLAASGADEHVGKPITDGNRFVDLLNRLLQRPAGQGSPASR